MATAEMRIFGPDAQPFLLPDEPGAQSYFERVLTGDAYPLVLPEILRASTIVDIGAHVGAASRLFKHRFPQARLVAYEPSPACWALLEANLARLNNVEIVRAGLGANSKKEPLDLGRLNAFEASLTTSAKVNPDARVEVDVLAVAEDLSRRSIDKISLLNIDTEGSELEILRAMKNLLPQTQLIYLKYYSKSNLNEILQICLDQFTVCFASAEGVGVGTLTLLADNSLKHMIRLAPEAVALGIAR